MRRLSREMLGILSKRCPFKTIPIIMVFMAIGSFPSLAMAGPEPSGWLGSLFGGTQLPPTGDNLIKAVEQGDLDSVKDLVSRGADVDYYLGQPLSSAAEKGHVEIVKYLLAEGASPNGTTSEEDSYHIGRPLLNAGKTNQVEIIDILLAAGASAGPFKRGGVLIEAAENGHVEAVRRLLAAGADPDQGGGYVAVVAADNGHLGVIQALIEGGANVSAGGGWIIRAAAREGQLEIVKALIEAGATKNLDSSLAAAAGAGHLDIVNLLLEKGADPNKDNPLKDAAENGSVEIVRILLEAGAIITTVGETSVLHFAASKGNADVIGLLVKHGADINSTLEKDIWHDLLSDDSGSYGKGWNVIHVAARFGYPIIQQLFSLGAGPETQDDKGRTPLHHAARYSKLKVAKELLKLCVNVSIVNQEGKTAQDIAIEQAQRNETKKKPEHEGLMTMLRNTLPEKIANASFNERDIDALREEFNQIKNSSAILKAQFKRQKLGRLWIRDGLHFIFKERARANLADAIRGHKCNALSQGMPIGSQVIAKCECIRGQGPTITLTPVQEAKLCSSTTPSPEVTTADASQIA